MDTRSLQARLDRRHADEAVAITRAAQRQHEDALPGDGDLAWVGGGLLAGCAVTVLGLAWLVLTGRL